VLKKALLEALLRGDSRPKIRVSAAFPGVFGDRGEGKEKEAILTLVRIREGGG